MPAPLLEHLSHQHGLLTTPVPGTVLVLAATVLGVMLLRRLRRGRRPRRLGRLRLTVRVVGIAGLVALSAGAYVNAYAGYLPTVGALEQAVGLAPAGATAAGPVTGGHVSVVRIAAPALGIGGGTTYVYTPPGYDRSPSRRYPVIYLIHGSPGTTADWFRSGRVDLVMDALSAAPASRPAIVVAMDCGGGLTGDTESLDVVRGPQVETYYTHVVVPYVDAHYRTVPDRRDRVLGGMSSGGFGALNVGLRHQDLYATILALEPYGDPGVGNLRRLLGGDAAKFRANSPSVYIRTLAFPQTMNVFLDVGGATGPDVRTVRALADALTARGQHVDFRVEAGQRHSWSEAVAGLPYALAFAEAQLPPAAP